MWPVSCSMLTLELKFTRAQFSPASSLPLKASDCAGPVTPTPSLPGSHCLLGEAHFDCKLIWIVFCFVQPSSWQRAL